MKFTWSLARRCIAVFLLILVAIVLIFFTYAASLSHRLRAAERRAHEFCDAIAIGSDISTAVAKAKAEDVFWGSVQGYTFYFPATLFDKAVCEVTVDREGKVVSKEAEMEYD
jgi:hypothetical protein